MYVPKSPHCHEIFGFSDLSDNLIPKNKTWWEKTNKLFSERRERSFSLESKNRTAAKVSEVATTVSELDTFAPCSPAKKNCSLDKINGNYSLEETEHSGVHASKLRLELGQG